MVLCVHLIVGNTYDLQRFKSNMNFLVCLARNFRTRQIVKRDRSKWCLLTSRDVVPSGKLLKWTLGAKRCTIAFPLHRLGKIVGNCKRKTESVSLGRGVSDSPPVL